MKVKVAIDKLATAEDRQERFRILARVIVWALLDQKPGKKRRKADRVRNAKQIGRIIYLYRMRSLMKRMARTGYSVTAQDSALCKSLIKVGGIDGLLKEDSTKTMVRRIRKQKTDYETIYRMVTYLICVDFMGQEFQRALTIDMAKASLSHVIPKGQTTQGFKTAENTWGRYARGSAVIFAIFEFFPDLSLSKLSTTTAAKYIAEIARSKENTEKFLGYASFAARVLRKLSKTKAFKNSFKNIIPLAPTSVTPIDRKIIENISDTAKARG